MESLVQSVTNAWNNSEDESILLNIFSRLKNVCCNILAGKGSNDLVENARGMKIC